MKEALLKHFFAPVRARFRLLLIFPVINLLVLSIILLFLKSPKEAILLAMGGISFVVFLIGSSRFVSLFYFSSLVFNLMVFFITWGTESVWSKGWSISMMLTLTVGYYLSSEVLDFFRKEEKNSRENETEKALWKNRFETFRDSHNLEILRLEEELSKSLEGFNEKNNQIEALEKLVEVTHKEAAELSRQKHDLLDKLRVNMDNRGDEDIKKQNIALQKEMERLQFVERDKKAAGEENLKAMDKIQSLQEGNRLFQDAHAEEVKDLKAEIEALHDQVSKDSKTSGYTEEDIFKLLKGLQCFKAEKFPLDMLLGELKEKLNFVDKPFKWQVWKGDKKEKKPEEKKAKISMNDLGKGLKI